LRREEKLNKYRKIQLFVRTKLTDRHSTSTSFFSPVEMKGVIVQKSLLVEGVVVVVEGDLHE